MESEFLTYLRIIRKWWWLIVLVVAVAIGVIVVSSLRTKPVYRAYVKLQVIAPEPQEVSLFSSVRSVSTSEEIVAVEVQFDAALRSPYVAWQTIADLNLGISAATLLDGLSLYADGEFMHLTFVADNAMLVESIATAHVENAFEYYAQTRAKPSTVALQFIQQQLTAEDQKLATAEGHLLDFKIHHNVDSLAREITAIQDDLHSLRLERAMLVVEREKAQAIGDKYTEAAGKTSSTESAVNYMRQAATQEAVIAGIQPQEIEYDKLIAAQEAKLVELLRLVAEHEGLARALNRVRSNYSFLSDKENEARLKQSQATNVSFIQIIEPARMPDRPAPSRTPRLLAIGGVVSLIGGIILAFVVEFLSSLRSPAEEREHERFA